MKMFEECWELFPKMRLTTDFAKRTKTQYEEKRKYENKIV